ncbi:MotA/TolQ/ExbB proton channel family protein [Orrella sp. NBD-18]|uniref:MotA/TolQ/ExbB proton channel family protein n=1 Tax=Sheuella amnicola TaxID=2707330 RepID=A0A6B2QX58_9BURK|nr:MotA/TolQ/ExbB proton channel family protein [Sheuella amnicola]NDY81709.1 MotA/TolQ/ExbB proton channel family protein [Sheuella amnicola]
MQSIVHDAGWPIWLLIALSMAGLTIIIERFLSLRTSQITPAGLTQQVIQMVHSGLDSPSNLQKLEKNSPLGRILAQLLRNKHLSKSELRLTVEDTGRDVAHQLNRYLPALSTIASVAPLLGLFGTVIGMIEIFAAYRVDGSDPTQLARGISVALYNTGFGILIAVPAMMAHRFFKTRVNSLLIRMEQSARHVLNALES